MQRYILALFVALCTVVVQAQNSTVDPTDIKNWPECAQNCIPGGFGPPASCGSLSNLTCICKLPTFSESIGFCEIDTCNPTTDFPIINELSIALCAPVGGYPAALSSTVAAYLQTAPNTYSATTATGTPMVPYRQMVNSSTTVSTTPSPTVFTGAAMALSSSAVSVLAGTVVGAVGMLALML